MDSAIEIKLDNFFKNYKKLKYKKGDILIRAEDEPSGVFYLKEGFVREYIISKKGDEFVVNVFKPISFFPMSWAINDSHNGYFYESITSVEVWIAPKEKTVEFIKSNPDILFDLMKRVYRGTDGLLSRMTYIMEGKAYARVLIELVIQAKRFGITTKEKPIEINISERELSGLTGVTRETVSRELNVIKTKGLVTLANKKILINNLDHLEEELLNS